MSVVIKLNNLADVLADIRTERKRFERAQFNTTDSLLQMRHLFKDMENAVSELRNAVESAPLPAPKEKV